MKNFSRQHRLPKGIEESIVVWHWRVVEHPGLDLCDRSGIRHASIGILRFNDGAIHVAGPGLRCGRSQNKCARKRVGSIAA